ncbi:MAG: S8 family serine peptidase [Halanaerobiales bacterium]
MFKKLLIFFLITGFLLAGCDGNKITPEKTYILTVTSGEGGSVSPSRKTVSESAIVELILTTEEGWVFSEWAGEHGEEVEYDSGSEQWKINVNGDKNVEAVFSRQQYNLDIEIVGEGSVSQELKTAATGEEFEHGEVVILTPRDEKGWVFSHWEGDLTGDDNPAEITIENDMNITAVFKEAPSLTGTITVEYNTSGASLNELSHQNNVEPLKTDNNNQNIKENTLIIGFQPNLSNTEKKEIVQNLGGEIIREMKALDAAVIKTKNDVTQNMFQAQSLKGVRYSEPDYIARATGDYTQTPDDEFYPEQWNLQLIDLPYSWSLTTGSSAVRTAVLDTGINDSHPDLEGRIDTSNGYNFLDNNYDTDDEHGHGTHVAGIIGSATNNYSGIAGTTWKGQILPVKVLDGEGNGSYSAIADGILYAAGLGEPVNPEPVDIINLSLGGYDDSELLREAVRRAREAGVLVIASSGNDGEGTVMYPAAYPEVIAVGAANSAGERASYSNYGENLDIIAPGGSSIHGIISTYLNSDYSVMAGTSMAAPHVAGVTGLMLASDIHPGHIREILQNTAIHPGDNTFSPEYGHGLINSNWALNEKESINIIIGTRQGDSIEEVATTTTPLKGGSYQIEELPAGEYQIFAWIDSNNDGIITPGDYITESNLFDFAPGEDYEKNLTIKVD